MHLTYESSTRTASFEETTSVKTNVLSRISERLAEPKFFFQLTLGIYIYIYLSLAFFSSSFSQPVPLSLCLSLGQSKEEEEWGATKRRRFFAQPLGAPPKGKFD